MKHHIWRSLCLSLTLIAPTLMSACFEITPSTPCVEDAPWVVIPSGQWRVRALGELTSCIQPDYNTPSFRLNTDSFRVNAIEQMGLTGSNPTTTTYNSGAGRLISQSPIWREGSFSRDRRVTFSLQEESPIGALRFNFNGELQWNESELTISGAFNISGACDGEGLFITLVEGYPEPKREYLKCEELEPDLSPPHIVDQFIPQPPLDLSVPDAALDAEPPAEPDAEPPAEPDAAPPPDPTPGQCAEEVAQGELNLQTVIDRAPEIASCVSTSCLLGFESVSSCANCIKRRLGISSTCSTCLYRLFECLVQSCPTECLSSGNACGACSERRCGTKQDTCF